MIKVLFRAVLYYFRGLKNGSIKPPGFDIRVELTPDEN
jgi:hypothetical protein